MTRRAIHPDVLTFLIRDAAARQPACREALCGDVVERPVDAQGCNWRLSKVQGSNCAACVSALLPFIRDLQARFDVGHDEATNRSIDLFEFLPDDWPLSR